MTLEVPPMTTVLLDRNDADASRIPSESRTKETEVERVIAGAVRLAVDPTWTPEQKLRQLRLLAGGKYELISEAFELVRHEDQQVVSRAVHLASQLLSAALITEAFAESLAS
jgi:hypothetical protein